MQSLPRLVLVLVLAFVLVACSPDGPAYEPGTYVFPGDAQVLPENALVATFSVAGMTCSGCEYNVTSALRRVDGTLRAQADHERGEATVTFDPDVTDIGRLVAAVSEVGYEARMPSDEPRPASPPTPSGAR
jgi:copper chaperone CopZ